MSLTLALNNALSGLNVNRQSLAVLSQNIANANTKGYSRKLVDQSAMYLDGHGSGVRIDDISRKVDTYLQRSIQNQGSDVGKNEVIRDYMDRVQILLGKPGASNSLDAFITGFFRDMQSLAETPELTSLRTSAVNSGVVLAREVRALAGALEDLRLEADNDISVGVDNINQALQEIFALNLSIINGKALGKPVGELLDQRDLALADLSQYLDIDTVEQANGGIYVMAGNGLSLLDDNLHEVSYSQAGSVAVFVNETALSAIQATRLDASGNPTTSTQTLATSGVSGTITSVFSTGKLKALMELRDETLPEFLAQLDSLASVIRDQFNAVHNDGSGYPGTNSMTGTRLVYGNDVRNWSGNVRIAVLDSEGKPVSSFYSDETSGMRPLNLDLSFLDSGFGAGHPTTQTIIDEINSHFGIPQNKAKLGNFNNIKLASDIVTLPGAPPQFKFDFDIENISAASGDFWVTGFTVLDDTSANITSVTSTIPSVNLAAVNTFVTTNGSTTVTVNTAAAHGLLNGAKVFMRNPGGAVNGIPGISFDGYFTVSNVTSTSYDITVSSAATASGGVNFAAQTALPKYAAIAAGEQQRTRDQGIITADLTANTVSSFYTITMNVAVDDGVNGVKTGTVTYRVNNSQTNLLNARYAATAAGGNATLVTPGTNQYFARATLVDADGTELPKTNGVYVTNEQGYLKIAAGDSSYTIAIDELDGKENGQTLVSPKVAGTGRGFSHYFELNNFFESNSPSTSGDTRADSAYNLQVEQRIRSNVNLVTLGALAQTRRPTDPDLPPYYTYERHVGDNSVIQRLAKLGGDALSFAAAGGLAASTQRLDSYAGEILGNASAVASAAEKDEQNAQLILEGFSERSQNISGVNLDEELANTIIYQNAYTASARVITVTNELFDALLDAV